MNFSTSLNTENVFISIQSFSCVQLFVTPWTAACQAFLSITNSRSLLKFVSIESVTPCNHLILCHPHLLLPSIFPSIKVFSNESVLHIRWPKYWSFSVSPSNEYSWLISFRIDWFHLLAFQGTLKNLLQHYSLKCVAARKVSWDSTYPLSSWPLIYSTIFYLLIFRDLFILVFLIIKSCQNWPSLYLHLGILIWLFFLLRLIPSKNIAGSMRV